MVIVDPGDSAQMLAEKIRQQGLKPKAVLLTHGHVDHAMGAPEFDTVYMSRKDDYIYMQHRELEVRKRFLSQSPNSQRWQRRIISL